MSNNAIDKYTKVPAKGSINDVAARKGQSISEVMADADAIVMIDVSGSMADPVSSMYGSYGYNSGPTRWQAANDALASLQQKFEGRIIVIKFDVTADWVLDGNIPAANGSTNLTDALLLAKEFDETGMRFIVISDGEPNSVHEAKRVADSFVDPIDTIYIGPAHGHGGQFLKSISTGTAMDKVDATMIEGKVTLLLSQ